MNVTCVDFVGLQIVNICFLRPQVVQVCILRTDRVCANVVSIQIRFIQIDVVDAWIQCQLSDCLTRDGRLSRLVPVQHVDDRIFTCNGTVNLSLQSSIQVAVSISQARRRSRVVRSSVSTVRSVRVQTSTCLRSIQFVLKILDVIII